MNARRTVVAVAVAVVVVLSLLAVAPASAAPPFARVEHRGTRVAVGADGGVWFAGVETIVRVDPATGAERRIALDRQTLFSDIAPGLAGDPVWVAARNEVLRVSAAGTTARIAMPPGVAVWAIEPRADGRMWFLGSRDQPDQSLPDNLIGTITAVGTVEVRDLPGLPDGATVSSSLGPGPNGGLWATLPFADRLVRIAADGTTVSFDVGDNPVGAPITGPDGRVWLIAGGQVVRVADDGTIVGTHLTPLPIGGVGLGDVESGLASSGDAVWVAAFGGVVRLEPDGGRPVGVVDADGAANPGQVVVAGGRVWFHSGQLDVARYPRVTVRALRTGGEVRLVAEVAGNGPAAGGTVTFEAAGPSHHGMLFFGPVGSAPVENGRAALTVPADDTNRTYRARYSGDGNWGPNTSPMSSPQAGWEQYVRGVYEVVLGRQGEAEGVAHWVRLLDRTNAPTVFTGALTASVEWRRLAVAGAYDAVLNRRADLAGRDFFVGVLGRGRRLAEVIASLASSPEYVFFHGGGDDGVWVDALFADILGRAPDGPGRAYLLGLRAAGRDRAVVAGAVAASPEAFGVSVDGIYAHLLQRSPDPGGRAYWIGRLRSGDVEAELVAAIAASDEFRLRVSG